MLCWNGVRQRWDSDTWTRLAQDDAASQSADGRHVAVALLEQVEALVAGPLPTAGSAISRSDLRLRSLDSGKELVALSLDDMVAAGDYSREDLASGYPCKDTAGLGQDPLIKIINIVALLLVPLACPLFGIGCCVAMQVVAVGFIIRVVQGSFETAPSYRTDIVYTSAVDRR